MPERKSYHHGDLKNALIRAGVEILAQEGLHAFSLRKVALRAGVSHSAPYAHFADRQALIAAISTEGFRKLYDQMDQVLRAHEGDPLQQLIEGAWAYLQFAIQDPAHFKITFSGVLEKEQDYPAFVELSHKSFVRVVEVVQACQQAGVLKPGPPDLLALSIWAQIHGLAALLLEGQVSHQVLDRFSLREILEYTLNFRCNHTQDNTYDKT